MKKKDLIDNKSDRNKEKNNNTSKETKSDDTGRWSQNLYLCEKLIYNIIY